MPKRNTVMSARARALGPAMFIRPAPVAILLTTTALTAPVLTAPVLITPVLAQALPTGGRVAAGSVGIAQPNATTLTITQASPSAIVNYRSFSVGRGNSVTFVQPNASSAILNRVTGNASSHIAGQVNANGQVYLVNPNGIAITRSGTVNAGGGFVGSTLGISDSDFMAGKRTFTGNGASAAVSNAGTISVGRGGYAALIGGTVSNSGSISVPLGKVGLGSGEQATMDFAGDGFLQVAVPTHAGGKGALVRNSGSLNADGGSVIVSAATAREAARNAVNISGVIQARSISGQDGSITIGGGDGGTVRIKGRLDASSSSGQGGRVAVTGRGLKLKSAVVDASGLTGGGNINIGGGRQGTGSLQHADTVSIGRKSTIKADATTSGNGGNVVVWSDRLTTFAGTISAKGGALSGNGGEAEVSGKATLAYTGLTDLTAPHGTFGNLLLDPYNVTIVAGSGGTVTGGAFTPTSNSNLGATTLTNALATANVTVNTGTSGAGTGSITLSSGTPLSWSSASTLTLDASRNASGTIALNSAITATNGGLILKAGSGGGITDTAALSVKTFTLASGLWSQNGATLPAFSATSFALTGGTFLRTTGGTGSASTPYLIADVYGLQGITTLPSSSFALANDINAGGTSGWNNGRGFVPIGTGSASFTGNFDGQGHTISNLVINRPTTDYVGLIGYTQGGSIKNVALAGAQITGQDHTGGIIGSSDATSGVYTNLVAGGAISGRDYVGGVFGGFYNAAVTASSSSGSVSGRTDVGGLAGLPNNGSVTQSSSTAVVTGTGGQVGGLIGFMNTVAVSRSSATGTVTGTGTASSIGGLIGQIADGGSSVQASYATGNVSGSTYVGGLIGTSGTGNTITTSYATGNVSATASSVASVGGLVGVNFGAVSQSYATGTVTGIDDAQAGGLVGRQEGSGSIANSFAMGAVTTTGTGSGGVGGLVGWLNDLSGASNTITRSYATGRVSGSSGAGVGGLIGWNYFAPAGRITSNYYDSQTTGAASGVGTGSGSATGLTTAQLQSGSLPTGFVSSVWATGAGLYPYQKAVFTNGVQAVSGFVYGDAGTTALSSGPNGAVSVNVLAGGATFGTATTGANGYYYAFSGAPIAANQSVLAYTSANAATGATNAATLTVATGRKLLGGLNLYGNTLTAPTSALTLSTTPDIAIAANAAAGGNSTALAAIAGASGRYYVATGSSFTIDQAVSTSNLFGVQTTAANAGIIVSNPITIGSGGSLALNAAGALAVNAPITVNGAGSVALAAGYDTTTVAGASLLKLSFGNGAGLTYANADGSAATSSQGGKLAINGQAYTLLYNLADPASMSQGPDAGVDDVAGIDSNSAAGGSAGYYALATNLTGTGTAANPQFNGALAGTMAGPFTGVFDGLGHTITNLTMASTGGHDLALFALNAGTIRNIGLVGGSVSNGSGRTAPLVAWNITKGIVANAYSSMTVSGGRDTGGLVGRSESYGPTDVVAIVNSYATGAVSGNNSSVGGLVGVVDVVGGVSTVVNSYATGAVTNGGSNGFAGGLVGFLDGASIQRSYSTGAVSGANSANLGGFLGINQFGNVSHSYWDTQTSGVTAGIGNDMGISSDITGLTTAQFQSNGASALGAAFAGGANGLYPYLKSFFPNGVQAVSGFAYQDAGATPLVSGSAGAASVSIAANGQTLGTVTTGANGYYYAIVPTGTLGATGVAAYTQNDGASGAQNAVSYASGTPGSVTTLDISGGWRRDTVGSTIATLSALQSGFASTTSGTPVAGFALSNRQITTTAPFAIDQALSLTGTLALNATGAVTQSAAITTSNLWLRGAGGAFALTNSGNAIDALVGNTGSIDVRSRNALTISAGISDATSTTISGVTTTGTTVVTSAGDLTLASGAAVSGADPLLAADGAFINNSGAHAVTATTGRWLIYSADPATDVFGGLDSGNTALWNAPAGTAVTIAGNRYIFAANRTLTVTTSSDSKTYGDDATASVATRWSISGFDAGVSGAYLADTAATAFAGAANVTSAGSAVTANVAGAPYAITASLGSLTSNAGYGFNFVNAGFLAVNSRGITITADAQSRVYGDANSTLTFTVGGGGLVNGDTLSGRLFTAANATSGIGSYGITQGSLAASSNYAMSYVGANLSVGQRAIIVTADTRSRVYGDANPTLTYTVGGGGLVNGDTLSGGLSTAANATSGIGNYGITQGSLAASSNYAMSYVGANLSVGQRAIIVTANAQSRVYGDANPTLTYTVGGRGLVNGDALAGSLFTAANATSGIGSYAIAQGSLAASSNYAVSYVGALLTVRPAVPLPSPPAVPPVSPTRARPASPTVAPSIDAALLASSITRDHFDWITLPDAATSLPVVSPIATTFGLGTLYSDPRFDGVLVCFAGGGGAAASCSAVAR